MQIPRTDADNESTVTQTLSSGGRPMTNKRRKLCQAFFMLEQPMDAESFWLQLKASGMMVSRAQVYKTLNLLTDYGFADRRHDERKRINVFMPR